MSLEVALQENTAAIRDLIAMFAKGVVVPTDAVTDLPAADKVQLKNTAPATEGDAKKNSAQEITYQDAANSITQLSRTKGRDAALKVLQGFGVDNLKGVKPEQFADVIAAAQRALGA